jgi:HK97 family phage major capsid protein
LEQQGKAFEAFKGANDERLKAIESKGYAPAEVEQKVDDLNAKIAGLSKEIEGLTLKAQRPAPGDTRTAEQAEHKAAFLNWVRKGEEGNLRSLERKAMTVGSDPDGGYLVGEEMEAGIDRLVGATVSMMRLATVRSVGSTVYKRRVRTRGVGYGWAGEEETPTETTAPQYAMLSFEPGKIWAEPQVSSDLLEDAEFDVESEIMDALEQDFGEGIGAALVTGNGINRPRGITSYTTVANGSYAWGSVGYIASGVSGSFEDADAIIDLIHALKPAYRANGQFLMNDLTLSTVRKMKDGEGNYIWQPSLQLGMPDRLLGYPTNTDDNMPDIAANSLSIAFGDFKAAYVVVERRGTAMLRDPYTAKPFVKFYTTKRIGGGIMNYEAMKFMKFAAS